MLVEPGSFSKIRAVIDGSHVPGGRVCDKGGGAHQAAETADMATLADPSLTLPPQGYPLTISCPVSAYKCVCADTAGAPVSHSFYLEPRPLKSPQAIRLKHKLTYAQVRAVKPLWIRVIQSHCTQRYPVPFTLQVPGTSE